MAHEIGCIYALDGNAYMFRSFFLKYVYSSPPYFLLGKEMNVCIELIEISTKTAARAGGSEIEDS